MSNAQRHCVIGAGYAGLPVAKRLRELGQNVDVFDRNSGAGGLWHTGIYDSARTISSKKTTGFPDYPMPRSFPDFPSRPMMQNYLQSYADAFGLSAHISFNATVERIRHGSAHAGNKAWQVHLATGETRDYDTVTIANGHFSKPRTLSYDGEFCGTIIQSSDYRDSSVFAGKRVLIVGFGNTASDVCGDAIKTAASVGLSMRGGPHFVPRTLFGMPVTDLLMALPANFDWSDRALAGMVSKLAFGGRRRRGLKPPTRRIFDELPVLNTEVLDLIGSRMVRVHPEILRFEKDKVHFIDQSSAPYDVMLSAVGYQPDFPMLDKQDGTLEWADGLPSLFMNIASPLAPGLYFAGLGRAWIGGGPMFQEFGKLIARMAVLQSEQSENVVDLLTAQWPLRMMLRAMGLEPIAKADMRPRGYGEFRRILSALNHAVGRVEGNRVSMSEPATNVLQAAPVMALEETHDLRATPANSKVSG